ncbi:MAG: hypothetical protein JXB26_14050 [Candidatus Aminicenantes bacterium]|nr:hypothetical protein [Candidatus Aminicenantes bacterium]
MRKQIAKLFIDHFCMRDKIPLRRLLSSLERRIIIRALGQVNGNQTEAAKILGVKYTTLNEKIKKYGIIP